MSFSDSLQIKFKSLFAGAVEPKTRPQIDLIAYRKLLLNGFSPFMNDWEKLIEEIGSPSNRSRALQNHLENRAACFGNRDAVWRKYLEGARDHSDACKLLARVQIAVFQLLWRVEVFRSENRWDFSPTAVQYRPRKRKTSRKSQSANSSPKILPSFFEDIPDERFDLEIAGSKSAGMSAHYGYHLDRPAEALFYTHLFSSGSRKNALRVWKGVMKLGWAGGYFNQVVRETFGPPPFDSLVEEDELRKEARNLRPIEPVKQPVLIAGPPAPTDLLLLHLLWDEQIRQQDIEEEMVKHGEKAPTRVSEAYNRIYLTVDPNKLYIELKQKKANQNRGFREAHRK